MTERKQQKRRRRKKKSFWSQVRSSWSDRDVEQWETEKRQGKRSSGPQGAFARLVALLLAIVLIPWYLLRAIGRGLIQLSAAVISGLGKIWSQRGGRVMLQSLPAVLAAASVGWLAIAVDGTKDDLPNRYQYEALKAYSRGDYEAARLYYERLAELDGGQERTQYELALCLAQLDQSDRADAIMRQLASQEKTGYPRAHLYLAERMLLKPETFRSREKLDEAYAHLKHALQEMPDSPQVNLRMSQFLVAVNRYDEAIRFLSHACKYDRKLYYELAMLLGTMNRVEEAKDAFRQARVPYEAAMRTNPQDQNARLHLASIRMNLDDFEGAVSLLREGQTLDPDGPFSRAIAHAFVTRYDKLQREGSPQAALQLELLRMALKHDPNSREVLTRMIDLGESSDEELKATRNVLETLLASGYANAFAHFVLGCKSWEAGESDAAIFHFERAYQLDDSLGPVANNLAWILSHEDGTSEDEVQLERALQLINSVVEQWPDNAAYRDTRGQVLVQLERWDEALDDLEFALPSLRHDPELHAALALTYENLGRQSLATKHQEIAMKLKE